MVAFSPFIAKHFKSSSQILCRVFFRSRNHWRQRTRQQTAKHQQLKAQLSRDRQEIQSLQARLAVALAQVPQQPQAAWHSDRPLPGHQFGVKMIALCCQLCLLIGFRATPKVLQCVSDAFDLQLKIPSRDTVRNWNCRNGVALLQELLPADDWIWMIDHSVQLGKMFVLLVLGIRRGDLPAGRALTRQDMGVLAVLPTTARNKDEVSRQLQPLAESYGQPLAVVCDGACELHEGVATLRNTGFKGVCLSDVKHKIANLLKQELGATERWKQFEGRLGTTTAAIQQTELEHLLPPRKKQKCRFMNFGRLIDWTTRVQDYLQREKLQPSATSSRLFEKLGWLSEFTADLKQWQQVRALIGVVLRQANEQGVWSGATEQLRAELLALPAESVRANQLRERLLAIVAANEALLETLAMEGLRLPSSTEVLESAFGAFKAIQRHHNRGTFTSLLAMFPTLFDDVTPQKIRARLSRVSNQGLAEWIEGAGLKNSTQSRRMQAMQVGSRKTDDFKV